MPDLITIPAAELAELKERLKRLTERDRTELELRDIGEIRSGRCP